MSEKERKNSKSRCESKNEGGVWKCESCNKEFREEVSKLLECERCTAHYCIKCMKLSDREYEFLSTRSDLHWFCVQCEAKVVKSIMYDKEIEQRCEDFFGQIKTRMMEFEDRIDSKITGMKENVSKEFHKISNDLNDVKGIVDQQLSSNKKEMAALSSKLDEMLLGQGDSWSKVVKREVDRSLEEVADNITEVQKTLTETRTQAAEQRDKENRRNNIILYKVPESTQTSTETRNDEDLSFCLNLFNNCMNVGMAEEDFTKVFRLGRREEGRAARPLMVQLSSYSIKNHIMESVFRLKQAEQKYKNIVIAHDMTIAEREECKKLVEEAKSSQVQDTSGEFIYRVRGNPGQMRVVKIRKRS